MELEEKQKELRSIIDLVPHYIYIKDIEKLINRKIEVVTDNPFPQTDNPMTNAEKKEWEKEKQKRKREFFANRKPRQGKYSKK